MVEKEFIHKLKNACNDLERSQGEVGLFAILKMDELTDKWTAVISADWVTQMTFQEAFTALRNALIDNIGDEINTIARIGIFSPDEHFAKLMMEKFITGDAIKDEQPVNGNIIHQGYIIKVLTAD